MLEARYHLLEAGSIEDAAQITHQISRQLHTRGAWDQEYALIHDTLSRLSADSPSRAGLIHQLGNFARDRGDYDEAERHYQRALEIFERLGDEAEMIWSHYQLGNIAYLRGDYNEAARQYQRALDISERLGDQVGIATSYSQLGGLEAEKPDGSAATTVGWHVKALVMRLRLGSPLAANNLAYLAAQRRELGPEQFTGLLSEATGDPELTGAVTGLLDQFDAAEAET